MHACMHARTYVCMCVFSVCGVGVEMLLECVWCVRCLLGDGVGVAVVCGV